MGHVMGVAHRTYASYERNERTPDATALAPLVAEGWNANWILTGEGPERLEQLGSEQVGLSQPARLDEAMLREAIEAVEAVLEQLQLDLTPRAKARVVAAAYHHLLAKATAAQLVAVIVRTVNESQSL